MAKTLKKSIKKQPVKTEVKKPSSIYFADYSNKVPTHITPVARPMVLAPTYNANAVLRAAGANVINYKPTAEQVNKIFKKIDYSNITDRNEIIDTAIDQVLGAETDPNKKKQLQTLLRMTNYMENKYGEADDAWKNKSVNYGFTELDKISIDNLFKPKGDKGNYTKGQKNAFEYLKNFGLPTDQKELEKLLLNNDPLANMAVSRLVYATNPKALPDMNDQKAVFNYWLNDYNHRGAIKHQTEDELFKIFQEGYNKYNSSDYKPVIHVNSDGTAVIDDNRGQWEYPGEVTRIASNDITMKGVPYPVLGVGADGEQRMMYPNEEHTFNQGPVTEYPMMEAQNGGWLSKYQNHENLRADGTKKGTGYFGVLNRPDGGVSTEISIGVNINGKEVEIPTMVPTLTKEELDYLLTNPVDKEDLLDTPIGQSIGNKAVEYSKQRMNKGLNPFYQEGEERSGLPRHLQNPGIASVYEENNKPDWTNVAPEYNRGGVTWLNEYAQGGRTFSAGGEKHKIYKKESPTGNGEGVKGHIMVTHPTMDKGEWDTIDLTEKSGARTVAQGVAATKKWHAENPEYQIGGNVNLASPEYAEYEFLKSLQSSSPGINTQQPVSEQPETELPMVSEKRTKGYNETLLNKLKGLIDPAGANEPEGNSMEDIIQLGTRGRQKGLTRASIFDKPEDIDFSELDRQQRTQQTQQQRTQTTQTSNYYSEEPMPQGVPAISNPIGKKAYAALVKELRKDSSTADDAINIAKLLLAQSALETGQWTSPAALKAGNLSGIKFYGQKGRKPSTVLAPGGEEKGYRRPYVQYDSPEDWASGMIQLMKGRYKDALYSTSPEEYAARLKARGYYSGDQSAYAKQMRNFFKQFKFQ